MALRHALGWYPFLRHFCMSAVMCFRPLELSHVHLSTRYIIWECPGAEFALFLKMASHISSAVTSVKGRSVSRRFVRSGENSWCSSGGGLVKLLTERFTFFFVGCGLWLVRALRDWGGWIVS